MLTWRPLYGGCRKTLTWSLTGRPLAALSDASGVRYCFRVASLLLYHICYLAAWFDSQAADSVLSRVEQKEERSAQAPDSTGTPHRTPHPSSHQLDLLCNPFKSHCNPIIILTISFSRPPSQLGATTCLFTPPPAPLLTNWICCVIHFNCILISI